MLLAILSTCSQEELDSESDGEGEVAEVQSAEAIAARRQRIKSKILAVGRMQKVFQILRFVLFFPASFIFIDIRYFECIEKRQKLLLNWQPTVLVGLLPDLNSTYKAPESTEAFVHLLMRKFP